MGCSESWLHCSTSCRRPTESSLRPPGSYPRATRNPQPGTFLYPPPGAFLCPQPLHIFVPRNPELKPSILSLGPQTPPPLPHRTAPCLRTTHPPPARFRSAQRSPRGQAAPLAERAAPTARCDCSAHGGTAVAHAPAAHPPGARVRSPGRGAGSPPGGRGGAGGSVPWRFGEADGKIPETPTTSSSVSASASASADRISPTASASSAESAARGGARESRPPPPPREVGKGGAQLACGGGGSGGWLGEEARSGGNCVLVVRLHFRSLKWLFNIVACVVVTRPFARLHSCHYSVRPGLLRRRRRGRCFHRAHV